MGNFTIRINGKLYAKAHKASNLTALAYFVKLSKIFPEKFFCVRKVKGINHNSLYRHLITLEKYQLVTKTGKNYKIASREEIYAIYGGFNTFDKIYVPKDINSIDQILSLLKGIPILSNIALQKRTIKKKKETIEHFRTVKTKIDLKVANMKEIKSFEKFARKNNVIKNFNTSDLLSKIDEPNLSKKGILRLTSKRSTNTAMNYTDRLEELKVLRVQRRQAVFFSDQETFIALKSIGKIPVYASWSNGVCVYELSKGMSIGRIPGGEWSICLSSAQKMKKTIQRWL